MEYEKLDMLKKEYLKTPIPERLDFLVKKALKDGSGNSIKKRSTMRIIRATVASAAVLVALLTAVVNTSPVFASTLLKVPVIRGIVEVLTFREFTVKEDRFNADIKVPSIHGLENKALESSLNEKYLAENKKLYEEFMAEMAEMQKNAQGNMGVDSGYIVKTDTDRILSVGRYVLIVKASGAEKIKYDTIDKKNEVLITLPSLFKDNSYVGIISENIKTQMRERMKADEGIIYWVSVEGREALSEFVEPFEKISEQQNFYISPEGKLVISFDEYEVGPGSMGIQEFIVPTEIIADILVSDEYIR